MWIIVEHGELFEGDLEEFNNEFGLDPGLTTAEDVVQFCEDEGWTIRVYSRQEESWN